MRLLLDTHIFLWVERDDPHLTGGFRTAIADIENEVFVSVASVWEIAIKRASGKLAFHGSVSKAVREHPQFHSLPITSEHAEWAADLPEVHRDPFDRLLVAQAQLEGLTLVTVDDRILRYQVPHL